MTTTRTAAPLSRPRLRTPAEVRQAVADHFTARRLGPDVVGDEAFARLVDEGSAGVVGFALSLADRAQ